MIYVLIVVGYLGGYVGGYPSTTFHEFTSRENCEAVKAEIMRYAEDSTRIHAFCSPK